MNNRIISINKFIDKLPNNINILINEYNEELQYYKYIETINDFTNLQLKGSIKYINKYDGKLRSGGLLVKIYNKNNDWYAVIKQITNKKYYISFKSNYIFYLESRSHTLKDWLHCFITDVDAGKYTIE